MNILRIITDLGLVRVISLDVDPRECSANILVQKRDSVDSEWQIHEKFNSMSDDYAYTNAKESAGRAVKEIAAQKAML